MTIRADPPTERELQEARSVAVDATMRADDLEAQARRARRLATAKMKHYEDIVLIAQGQGVLSYDAEEAP